MVRIEYSRSADALYVYFQEVGVARSREIEDGIVLDFDAEGQFVGIEVLDASERFGLSQLVNVWIENLPLERV